MIETLSTETLPIRQESDVILLGQLIRQQSTQVGMSSLNKTKLVTAASELARNMLNYAVNGRVEIERIRRHHKIGIRLTFADKGPGIADIDKAMLDGYSTGSGMGVGLPGAKRLVDEFSLISVIDEGTTIIVIKWLND
ncbi:anti-sigma regulatory factor [Spirosoma taeanense]|uniref:Anti-sigma regulatory factor n=1 Tax=Spirosoma taeanense TaxID=2735870 RepID=A0A6M5YDN2_9BACT|nr:anti-sigma regulatory factor [Spirosoma taeanense]QJW91420.1 anti-sigma regulatory factor [Spirosoma taeanense]